MDLTLAEKIANAVLYEGYILYPYRPSAVKNRQRWTFGGVYPQAYSQAQGGMDSWRMQTECLLLGSLQTTLTIKVRFLQLLWRQVAEVELPLPEQIDPVATRFRAVEVLSVGGRRFHTWQEAVEQEVQLSNLDLRDLVTFPHRLDFAFPSSQTHEFLYTPAGKLGGRLVRRQQAITGAVEVFAHQETQADNRLFKLTIQIMNLTPLVDTKRTTRDEALMRSLVSTHTILSVQDGEFVSLLDPPTAYRAQAATCCNIGAYPVLVGEADARNTLLSSPIILYDYPQIAPESPFDLFDGTEIDEMLMLRILTLTDAEKEEMRQTDERTRELLNRVETLPPEHLMKLHGTVRSIWPLEREL